MKEVIIKDSQGVPIYVASSKEVGGVIVFIVFFLLIVAVLIQNNRPSIRKAKAEQAKKRLKRMEEEDEKYRQKLMNDPNMNINTEKFYETHRERLRKYDESKYQGITYYRGPRGGIYYYSRTGAKTYL